MKNNRKADSEFCNRNVDYLFSAKVNINSIYTSIIDLNLIDKKMKYWFLILLIFTIYVVEAKIYPKHQIGLGYSSVSGSGITYQLETDPDNVFEFSFFAYYVAEEPPDRKEIFVNGGMEYQRNLYKDRYNRFFGYAGSSVWDLDERDYEEYIKNDVVYRDKTVKTNRVFITGLGVGYERRFEIRMAVEISAGYQFQASRNRNFGYMISRGEEGLASGPSIGFSIKYIFN